MEVILNLNRGASYRRALFGWNKKTRSIIGQSNP